MKSDYYKTTAIIGAFSALYAPMTATAADGAAIYKSYCSTCHDTGMAGTPKLSDKAAWKERLAQGGNVLEEHSIKGYKNMPPRGGFSSLSDEEVKAAVAYMIKTVQ